MKTFTKDLLNSEQIKESIVINVSLQSHDKNNPFNPDGFLNWKIPLDEFDRVVRDFGGSYSPCHYKNSYRKDDEAIQGSINSIMLDFDDGLSLKEAFVLFADYEGIIATTKSHQKDKNGVVCDRFRVILPTNTPINLNKNEYRNLMSEVMNTYIQADKACKNISRFYFMYDKCEVWRLQGEKLFNWEKHYELVRLRENAREIKSQNSMNIVKTNNDENLTKLEWYRKYKNTEQLLVALKFEEKFVSGQRNNTLFSWASHLKEVGLSDGEVREMVSFLNNRGDSIKDRELEQLFRGLQL